MNDNAKKWVEALRSGRFQQGRDFLATDNGHCCLGVACEVAMENGVKLEVEEDVEGDRLSVMYENVRSFDGVTQDLPPIVRRWLGLATANGRYQTEDCCTQLLTELNDDGVPFAQIADIIESEPEGLFADGK